MVALILISNFRRGGRLTYWVLFLFFSSGTPLSAIFAHQQRYLPHTWPGVRSRMISMVPKFKRLPFFSRAYWT